MRSLLLATALALMAGAANASVQLATFGQTSNSNTITATVNGADTQTTLSADATINLTQFFTGPLLGVNLQLNATSVDSAQTVASAVIQHFSGSFCISTSVGCGGTNLLSGTFTDAAFGGIGGPGLVVNVNNPPDTLVLTSAVIPAADLVPPSSFGLSFTSLTPVLAVLGSTIAPFTASFSGTVSANAAAVPEPTTLALMSVGLLGLTLIRRKRA